MANPTHSNPSIQNFAPGQTVRTETGDGEWMFLHKASEVTGLHEKTLRRYIKKKLLKSKRLGKQVNSPLQVWITPDIMQAVEAEASYVEEADDASDEDDNAEDSSEDTNTATATDVEQVIRVIAQQFADKLDEQTKLIFDLRTEILEKEKQLLLLPDLKKKMEEAEQQEKNQEFEKTALEKQVQELQAELDRVNEEKAQLEQKPVPWWKTWFGAGS